MVYIMNFGPIIFLLLLRRASDGETREQKGLYIYMFNQLFGQEFANVLPNALSFSSYYCSFSLLFSFSTCLFLFLMFILRSIEPLISYHVYVRLCWTMKHLSLLWTQKCVGHTFDTRHLEDTHVHNFRTCDNTPQT